MRKTCLFRMLAGCCLLMSTAGAAVADSDFLRMVRQSGKVMVVIRDAGQAGDFVEYAEILLKRGLMAEGAVIIDPELMEKIKEDRLLFKAIENANASAMAAIATDYGAGLLVRGDLSVDARQKFAAAWEGTAALSMSAVNTATAEEIASVSSDPFGTGANPAPIEGAPLIAKQMAVKSVCHNVMKKFGILADDAALEGPRSIAFELYDSFSSTSGQILEMEISPGGDYILACGADNVEQWDLADKKQTRVFAVKGGRAAVVAISPDSRTFAVGDRKGRVHIFDIDSPRERFIIQCHGRGVADLAFGPDSTLLASAGQDGTIRLVNAERGTTVAVLEGHSGPVNSIAVASDGRQVISAGNDLSIKLWDINVQKQKRSIQESADKLLKMVLSRDGSMSASSTVDVLIDLQRHTRKDLRRIKIRNTVTGEEIRTLEGHQKDVTALAFHPDKRFLASGGDDRSIRIWDLQMGDTISRMDLDDTVACIDFGSNGKWFAALSGHRRITVWTLR